MVTKPWVMQLRSLSRHELLKILLLPLVRATHDKRWDCMEIIVVG
jgi:hypothetical protein